MGRKAAEKKQAKTGASDNPKSPKFFVAPASQVPAKIVFLVLLMLIFEHPIQIITLLRIHLVPVIKGATCHVRPNKF